MLSRSVSNVFVSQRTHAHAAREHATRPSPLRSVPMRVYYSFSLSRDRGVVGPLAEALRRRGYEPTIPVDRHIRVHNWRCRGWRKP